MTLKRLGLKELQDKCKEVFYDYMSSDQEKFYDDKEFIDCSKDFPTPMHMLWKETQDSIEENKARLDMFREAIAENKGDEDVVKVLKEQMKPLEEEREYFLKSSMQYQKELYKKTGVIDYSRSFIRIPLDKRINSFYDDLILEVVFYDNIGVNNGEYDTYKRLETQEERKNFIIKNTEITHLGLVILSKSTSNQLATIALMGSLDFDNDRVKQSGITLLPQNFADFDQLTLAETMDLGNNDLRQLFQTKIDLDKEDLKLLSDLNIKGDNYKLFKLKGKAKREEGLLPNTLFIRYVCPSTQRVYYNSINTEYLKYSNYFKENDFDSYIKAWWNVTHLGTKIEEGTFTRC